MTGPGTPAASAYRGAIATRFATRAAIVSSSHPSNIPSVRAGTRGLLRAPRGRFYHSVLLLPVGVVAIGLVVAPGPVLLLLIGGPFLVVPMISLGFAFPSLVVDDCFLYTA